MWSDNAVHCFDQNNIVDYISCRSASMQEYLVENMNRSSFSLWYKTLTHSDLPTRGKRVKSTDGFERNLLYYLSESEMNKLKEAFPDKNFECAKQSNIGMPKDFYKDIGVPDPRECVKEGHTRLNDYMEVLLVNDTLEYFSLPCAERIMERLGKKMPQQWKSQSVDIDLNNTFTNIEISEAVHGLGTSSDSLFQMLRLTLFLNDTIIFLAEHNKERPRLFVLLERNPVFYSIMGYRDKKWADQERLRRFQERGLIKEGLSISEITTVYQNEWEYTLLP